MRYQTLIKRIPRGALAVAFVAGVVFFGGMAGAPAAFGQSSFIPTRVETVASRPATAPTSRIFQVLRTFSIPGELGFIREIHTPKNPQPHLVIFIQDMHANYEAQKHIAGILDHLVRTFQLKVICVEGGTGKIDLTFYRELPDENAKAQVADYFLREARINGTEYYAITTKDDIALYGVENQDYYDKNLEAFMNALPDRQKLLEGVMMLENNLTILKHRIYNKRLIELDDHVVAYQDAQLPFDEYVTYLGARYPAKRFHADFPLVAQVYDAIQIQKKLNLAQAEKQREELIDFLQKNLPRGELETLIQITVDFKDKKLEQGEYHGQLRDLFNASDRRAKSLDRLWPELAKYIEYIEKYELVDKVDMFAELDQFADRLKDNLYTSITQKQLDQELAVVRLAKNLFLTQLLPRDLERVNKYKDRFNARRMGTFIRQQARRLKLSLPEPENLELIQKNLPAIENFYRFARQRDDILIGNTLESLTQEKEHIAVLVAGGFHTEGMSAYLRENRISYAVITPKVENYDEDDTRYINALMGKKTPFELQLEREEQAAQ